MATIELKQIRPSQMERPVRKVFFGRSESARAFRPDEKAFILQTLNDGRAWPFQWIESSRAPHWIVTLEDQAYIDSVARGIKGLSVTFLSETPASMLSLQNWVTVPRPLEGLYSRTDYCRYLVLHECGHALGLSHARTCGPDGKAPIMIQQTRGLQGCAKNTWPLPNERGRVQNK